MTTLVTVKYAGARSVADWGAGPRVCAVGRSGIGIKHAEGDRVTPAGLWPLRRVFYRPDRLARPECALPVAPIGRDDGWCDAPDDPHYNELVRLPYAAHAEAMWHDDALYDLVVAIGFNDAPAVAGKGSAIFFHVAAPDYRATAGCVALARADLAEMVFALRVWAQVRIVAPE